MEGWIKLYRQLLESPIFNNEKLLKVWIWCLLKATHKGYEQFVGKQLIYIKVGQFVTGRKRASEELRLKEGTVYDYIKTLEKEKMLDIKSNNKFSIISIINWEKYQIEDNETNNKFNNKITTNQHKQECKEYILYFIKKYDGKNLTSLNKKMKFLKEIQNDEKYKELTSDEVDELRIVILGGTNE